jgi:hypothetical protein
MDLSICFRLSKDAVGGCVSAQSHLEQAIRDKLTFDKEQGDYKELQGN